MNLGNQKLFNFDDAMQSPRGFLGSILFHQRDRRVNLMQDLLEPKFISLVHGDEQQLIVLGRRRQTGLQVDQFGDPKIFVVRKRCVFAVFVCHWVPIWSAVASAARHRFSFISEFLKPPPPYPLPPPPPSNPPPA